MKPQFKSLRALLISCCAAVGCSLAQAASVITIPDNASDFNSFTSNGSTSQAGSNTTGSSLGSANDAEDQETERVGNLKAIAGQAWDLEAFYLDGKKLSLIGGYDFLNGQKDGRPGDLFIKVGYGQPNFTPLTNPTNGLLANLDYGYTYAIDLSLSNYASGSTYNAVSSFGATAVRYDLNDSSMLQTVVNDGFGSNPWKYDGTSQNSTSIWYSSGLNTAGVNMLLGSSMNLGGTYHNVLTVDLSFISNVPDNMPIWFSYTMECGNDSMKGKVLGGFTTVPDSSSSILLIGLGFAVLGVFHNRRSKV